MDVRGIGVPMDLGSDRRGVDMGPAALRYAGLAETIERLGHTYDDAGNIPIPRPEGRDPNAEQPSKGTAKYLRENRWVARRIESSVADAVENGTVPLVLGGDHSVAIGSINGASRDRDVGVLWIDAHGDFNTPATTDSGNVHGMPLAAVLGRGIFGQMEWAAADIEAENVALVGLRNLDSDERKALVESDVTIHTMRDIDNHGIQSVLSDAIETAIDGTDALHVSFDIDVVDPADAPGVGTPADGGLTYREASGAMERIAETDIALSIDMVEVNPVLDSKSKTAECAVDLLASAFGERIL